MDRLLAIISVGDIIFAAITAFFITSLFLKISYIKDRFKNIYKTGYNEKEYQIVFQKCCMLFPNTTVLFKGKTFTRGMIVSVTTIENKTISGKLVGLNDDQIICLLTDSFIAADTIDNILEIISFDDIKADREGKI